MTANAMLALLAAGWLAASAPVVDAAPNPGQAEAGLRLAQRHCGGCHAVAAGTSPLADAPPFRDIHRRYGPDGLRGLLSEGMIKPSPMPEEGSVRTHPRMPMAELGEDETADLVAYLRSLEPAPTEGCHGAGASVIK
jgi:mono/diheme cytochrome c family protein